MESVIKRVVSTCKIVRCWGMEMGTGSGWVSTDDEEEDVRVVDSESFSSSIADSILCRIG